MGRTSPRISKLISITIAISLTIFTTDLSSAAVKATHNKAGRVNVNVVNTILSGKGVPSASIGIDGDFYLDKTGLNLYGPKTSGKWNIPASLRGPVGPQGPVGIAGKDGLKATSSSTTGLVGPKGDTGLQGLTGIAGATGPQGATGSTGSSGGGSTGAPGSNGSNGTNGLPGAKGETGTAGSPGSNGSKGDTGTVGPSEIRVETITFPAITGVMDGTSILTFGNFAPGKIYVVRLYLHARNIDGSYKQVSLTVSDPALTNAPPSSYVVADAHTKRGTTWDMETDISAEIFVDGSAVLTSHQLTAVIYCSQSVSTPGFIMTGTYSAQLIGAIL